MNNFKFDQLKEEIDKATQINSLSFPDKETIIRAEQYAFFNGAIRFLYRNENGEAEWDGFAKKFENTQKYFDSSGVAEVYRKKAVLLRYFLAKINTKIDFWFGNGKVFWRNKVLLDEKYKDIVSDILANNLNENLSEITEKEWVIDETLIADAIKHDGDADGQWCILYAWNNCHETLTRYAVRVSGNINHPNQVIPLNMKRNNLLGEFPSLQKRGSCYFVGWETDIKFEYKGNEFTWHEGTPCQVYWEEEYFDVEDEETKESFREKLDKLINQIQLFVGM